MRYFLFIAGMMLVSCSNENAGTEIELYDGATLLENDAATYAELVVMDNIAVDRLEYGCAKVYLQVPRQYSSSYSDTPQTIISHELWSIPVQRLPGNNVWTSIDTEFNTSPPITDTGDLHEGDSAYAIIMMQDGSVLYDQSVRAVTASKEWYVCENYYCEPGGCQSYEESGGSGWTCNPSQQRLLDDQQFTKCPCTFNSSGYPHCEFKNEEI